MGKHSLLKTEWLYKMVILDHYLFLKIWLKINNSNHLKNMPIHANFLLLMMLVTLK